MLVKIFHDKQSNQTWAVMVQDGEVFFFDCRYEHTNYGQFVSSYNLSTLLDHTTGLSLYGGVASWYINADCFQRINKWLNSL